MKLIKDVLLVLVAISTLSNCNSSDDPQLFKLIVNQGSGSGDYPEGRSVAIKASATPEGQQFDKWSGDTQYINSITSANATLTMPAKAVEVTATFKPIDLGPPIGITVDPAQTFQEIDGFGFFGAQDAWWGNANDMWNADWGTKVITDLGISIWRNEYYPPATENSPQDANWNKQKPVVEGLKAIADEHEVPLKFIFTVWSPPEALKWQATMSWAGDENATRSEGTVSTKNGGTLNPNKYNEYAQWIKDGIQLYKDAGIDLYALSLQNEPMFKQTFNSCQYTKAWYNELHNNVVPLIKQDFPNVKIFGSENMLEMEGASNNYPYFYHHAITNSATIDNIDIFAVHGYSDGLAPTSGSKLAESWTNHLEQFATPKNKKTWMTETSGYLESWNNSTTRPGALSLALDMHAAFYYGNASAWVWWQGSSLSTINEFNLMKGTTEVGKKYAISKHFFRYIRPGAKRVEAVSSDDNNIFVTAYTHATKATTTIVVINAGSTDKNIYVDGNGLAETFNMYRTNATTENCNLVSTITKGAANAFTIPAKTVLTLQAGGDPL